MSLNNIKKVKIFAHDAASANIVVAYTSLKYNSDLYQIIAYPKGPAIKIFHNEIYDIATIFEDESYDFESDDIVITGLSGIHSNYEIDIIKIAKNNNVGSITSLLDRAINIDDRFDIDVEDLIEYLPDRILVPSKSYKESKYKQVNDLFQYYENPYWKYIYNKYYKLPLPITNNVVLNNKDNYIVYFSEYIYGQYGESLGYDEFTSMEDFISIFNNSDIPIFIKLHPSEDKNKYNKYIFGNNIYVIKDEVSTQELLYYAKVVFGNMSSVFYEALLLEKESYSLQLNFKRDIFELTLENKIKRVETAEHLQQIYKKIISG